MKNIILIIITFCMQYTFADRTSKFNKAFDLETTPAMNARCVKCPEWAGRMTQMEWTEFKSNMAAQEKKFKDDSIRGEQLGAVEKVYQTQLPIDEHLGLKFGAAFLAIGALTEIIAMSNAENITTRSDVETCKILTYTGFSIMALGGITMVFSF